MVRVHQVHAGSEEAKEAGLEVRYNGHSVQFSKVNLLVGDDIENDLPLRVPKGKPLKDEKKEKPVRERK